MYFWILTSKFWSSIPLAIIVKFLLFLISTRGNVQSQFNMEIVMLFSAVE